MPKPLTLHTLLLELVPVAQGQAGPGGSKTSLAAPQAKRYVLAAGKAHVVHCGRGRVTCGKASRWCRCAPM